MHHLTCCLKLMLGLACRCRYTNLDLMASPAVPQTNHPPTESLATVLLVEDDQGLRESLGTVLAFQGLEIVQAAGIAEARQVIDAHDPDLLILDVNLQGDSGIDLLREVRQRGDNRQILLLTALHEIADRVAGLDAGADDYLAKPFALEELLARVRVMLRRAGSPATSSRPTSRTVGGVTIESTARRVTVTGSEVTLTKREFELLDLLSLNLDQVLTRAIIHERIWGYNEQMGSNTLEVLVSNLRRKLEAAGAERIVHTVRGVGYVVRPREASLNRQQ